MGRRKWEPQIAALAPRHRVIACDVRGFGLSAPPRAPGAYSQALFINLDEPDLFNQKILDFLS